MSAALLLCGHVLKYPKLVHIKPHSALTCALWHGSVLGVQEHLQRFLRVRQTSQRAVPHTCAAPCSTNLFSFIQREWNGGTHLAILASKSTLYTLPSSLSSLCGIGSCQCKEQPVCTHGPQRPGLPQVLCASWNMFLRLVSALQ